MDEGTFADTLSAIYDTALARERWPDLLRQLGRTFHSPVVATIVRSFDRTRYRGFAVGVDPDDHEEFLRTWHPRSIYQKRTRAWYVGEVITSRELVPVEEVLRSEVYNEYMKARDMHEGMRLTIRNDDGVHQSISLMRPWSAGAYDAAEVALGRILLPHLQRAVTVARRLRDIELMSDAAWTALDSLRHAVLLMDRTGSLIHFNRSAEALLAEADGLELTASGLRAIGPAITDQLHAVIAKAGASVAHRKASRPVAGALRLPRCSGRPALALIAMPMSKRADWHVARQPAVLVCVSDPGAGSGQADLHLSALFGLTQAEARLAADLLSGLEVKEIAERQGRSVATVRAHLARLLAKTETSRQSELMRLLMRIPIARRDL